MKKQTVSILCPSYNHEKFVHHFITSLLNQTNPNWELIIVDDCSTDNNVHEIEKFKDSRITLIKNPFNMGVNSGLNKAFSVSSGQYIAFCASDDMLRPDYIENVFKCFDSHPDKDLMYCNLQVIDNNNNLIKDKILNTSHQDRFTILRTMFLGGNCVNSPGMVVRRKLFEQISPLDIPMSQYQDYKMHIDLLLRSDYIVMDKISVLYRKNDSQSGLSAVNEITARRCQLEEGLLMDSFLKIQDIDLLRNIFGDDLYMSENITTETIPFVLGNMALKSRKKYKQLWGYNQIIGFINNLDNYSMVNKLYGFSYKDFLGLAKHFKTAPEKIKYIKYKKLFNTLLIITFILLSIITIITLR